MRFGILFVVLAASIALDAAPQSPHQPPSIVVIVTDDQRWDTLQFMPILQGELISRGVQFVNAFSTTPLCCPSRASVLTGQYAHRHDVLKNREPEGGAPKFRDRSTLATWLHAAGYRTGLFGKYLNRYEVMSPYIPPGYDEWNAFVLIEYYNYSLNENGVERQYGSSPEEYSTTVLVQKTVDFIELAARADEPFFAYFAPYAPHEPATPHPSDIGKFKDLPPWRPPSYNEADVSDKPTWVRRLPLLSEEEQQALDVFRRRQLESLQAVDRAVGDLVDAVRRAGRIDSTVFVFIADNGFAWGEHRWIKKSCIYEECIRVPFIITAPGIGPRNEPAFALNIDLAPTLAELAGASPQSRIDGRSLAPLLRDPSLPWRDAFLTEFWGGAITTFAGIRTSRWIYGEYTNGERELYDLPRDPYQLTSRSSDPRYEPLMERLHRRLERFKK